jgi:hypothetical protein
VKHADPVGQSLLMLELAVKTRIQSVLSMKAGGIAHRSTALSTMTPTAVLFEAVHLTTSHNEPVAELRAFRYATAMS